jgi:hypothetical protein
LLYLRLNAGEVSPAQGDQDFMAVQGGFERNTDWGLWERRCGSIQLRGYWLVKGLNMAVGVR